MLRYAFRSRWLASACVLAVMMLAGASVQSASGQDVPPPPLQPAVEGRLVFVQVEDGGARRLAITGADGGDVSFVHTGDVIVAAPRLNPTSSTILFTRLEAGRTGLHLLDPETRRSEALLLDRSTRDGRFFQGGKAVIFVDSVDGADRIGLLDLATRTVRYPLKTDHSISSPSAAPDGKDRFVYIAGGNALRVASLAGKKIPCAKGPAAVSCEIARADRIVSAEWSPTEDAIVFAAEIDGQTSIMIANADGSGTMQITAGANDSHPTWSSDGLTIMFSRKVADAVPTLLWAIARDGRHQRRVTWVASGATEPALAPSLK